MRQLRATAAALALLLGGCRADVSGQVVDASSGAPVSGATVEITNVGWGRRNGQLVWDKAHIQSDRTGADGRFTIAADGGVNMRVSAPGHAPVETSLCSRSPMLVRVGGPFAAAERGTRLRLPIDGSGAGWTFEGGGQVVEAADADLVVASWNASGAPLRLKAPNGIAFRPGTGNPPAPPRSGFAGEIAIEPLRCGWLFVRSADGGVAAVRTGSFMTMQQPGGAEHLTLDYAELPQPAR